MVCLHWAVLGLCLLLIGTLGALAALALTWYWLRPPGRSHGP